MEGGEVWWPSTARDTVAAFLLALNGGDRQSALEFLDPEKQYSLEDIDALRLSDLLGSGWAVSTRERVVGIDVELVIYAYLGVDKAVVIDKPTDVPACPFEVRYTGHRWVIAHIGHRHDDS
jgi:hypothetical protein